MKDLNRRDVVVRLGAVAGLAAIGAGVTPESAGRGAGIGAGQGASFARQTLRSIRLSEPAEQALIARMGAAGAPSSSLVLESFHRPERPVEGQSVERTGPDGAVFARGLSFTCDPRVRNLLVVDGEPLAARRLCFSVDEIQWTPGFGCPVYTAFCPLYEYAAGACYPEAKWRQVVPMMGAERYFTGCQASDMCVSPEAAAVCFDINDRHYNDSAGYYVTTIWGWC